MLTPLTLARACAQTPLKRLPGTVLKSIIYCPGNTSKVCNLSRPSLDIHGPHGHVHGLWEEGPGPLPHQIGVRWGGNDFAGPCCLLGAQQIFDFGSQIGCRPLRLVKLWALLRGPFPSLFGNVHGLHGHVHWLRGEGPGVPTPPPPLPITCVQMLTVFP